MSPSDRNGSPPDLLNELLDGVVDELRANERTPEATYRLQFHAGFTFRDATQLVPYLDALGITDAYASPYLKASPGSLHGYDIIDHAALNPEIGSEEEYDAWVAALREHGLGQILDVVPNHMGITGNENPWWNDVLENGPCSAHAETFDIAWESLKTDLQNKVMLPILGEPYGKVLESGQLQLGYQDGAFAIHYYKHRFPVSPSSYGLILRPRWEELEQRLGKDSPPLSEYQSILTAISHLPPITARLPEQVDERRREKEVVKRRLAALTAQSAEVRSFLDENVALLNGQPGDPHSFDSLDELLGQQAYRLAFWRVASDEINYRRFFDINELAALNMERPDVFAAAHALIFRLLREGKVTGMRIDHPDGLYDPRQYLQRLQEHYLLECARQRLANRPAQAGLKWSDLEGPLLERIQARRRAGEPGLQRPLYVVVEKILARNEPLPEGWPVHGTTGYEFLNSLNGLFVDPANAVLCRRVYQRWIKHEPSYPHIVYAKKFLILQVALASELHMLGHQLAGLSEKHRSSRDFTRNSLRHALREIIACFPVYRSYIGESGASERDAIQVEIAVARAKQRNPAISGSLFDFVRCMLLLRYPEGASESDRADQRRFVGKFEQVTSPVMAKGVEDTAFYVFNCLVSLNEVGGDPSHFGEPPVNFHRRNQERQDQWPSTLSATSTHDSKRSEDVRARIDVLSEMPQEWQKALSRWNGLNKRHRIRLDYTEAPDRNTEYLLYQTLVGAWPVGTVSDSDYGGFVHRIQAYMEKANHEAKVHTSWINPNPAYDEAVARFIGSILDAETNRRFVHDIRAFQRRVSHFGLLNALAQVLFKIGSPGVADIYQGTELWDFSLVDPDNRRPVDYALRQKMLDELDHEAAAAGEELPRWTRRLAENKEDGRAKLYVVHRALHCRRDHPRLFTHGAYQPVGVAGQQADHLCAFVRQRDGEQALVAGARLTCKLLQNAEKLPLGPEVWGETRLLLPPGSETRNWRNVFTNEVVDATDTEAGIGLAAAGVFAHFPVALLVAQE